MWQQSPELWGSATKCQAPCQGLTSLWDLWAGGDHGRYKK